MDEHRTADTAVNAYPHVVRYVQETPWAIMPDVLATISELLELRASGARLSKAEINDRLAAAPQRQPRASAGAVAVISVMGVISYRASLMGDVSGMASVEALRTRFRQALNDEQVSSILLQYDSPGGVTDGIPEMAQEIREARGQKPIVAVADVMAASAAYWLAVSADELVVTPSGQVGSIGVYGAHNDRSGLQEKLGVKTTLISAGKYKVEGHPFGPLDDDAREAIQARVDEMYEMFVDGVARGRGVKASAVRAGFGQGRILGAKAAVAEGMADRVETFDATLARLQRGRRPRPRATSVRRASF